MEDSGLYECQVSTTPVMSHYIYLTVAEPYTEIVGGAEIYLDEGSMMNITCLVKDSPEPPNYIFWYHNKKVIITAMLLHTRKIKILFEWECLACHTIGNGILF